MTMSTKELYKSNDTRHAMNINAIHSITVYKKIDIDIES